MEISVAIVDDHPMIINGLKNMLQGYSHIVITGAYHDGDELFKGLALQQPDVLLLDIQLPGTPGDELALRILREYPAIRILALTNFSSTFYLATMLRHGALGYLLKTTKQDTLIEAIETVFRGVEFIEPSMRSKREQEATKNSKLIYSHLSLTIREKEVLKLLVAGKSNQEIADELFIGYHTVRNYRARIFDKLEVSSISELVHKTLTLGLSE